MISSLKRKLASILPFRAKNNNLEARERVKVIGSASTLGGGVEGDDRRPRKRQCLITIGSDDAAAADTSQETTNPLYRLSKSNKSSWFTSTPLLVGESDLMSTPRNKNTHTHNDATSGPPLPRMLPHDALTHCFSYINTPSDRFGLQVTCSIFRKLSNREEMLATLDLMGGNSPSSSLLSAGADVTGVANGVFVLGEAMAVTEREQEDDRNSNDNDDRSANGNLPQRRSRLLPPHPPLSGGIILNDDTSDTACEKLVKFAAAGNMQAVYMIAMILCYCHENTAEGLALLRHAAAASSSTAHLPSIYALALILRDSHRRESEHYLAVATSLGYAPAWQEKLTAVEMRNQFGDLDASQLMRWLDPPCLNQLLGRHYVECQRVRNCQTSHCWNPLCGRWAYKALRVENNAHGVRLRARVNGARDANPIHGSDDLHLGGVARQNLFEPLNASDNGEGSHSPTTTSFGSPERPVFSIESLLLQLPAAKATTDTTAPAIDSLEPPSPLQQLLQALRNKSQLSGHGLKVSRMKMCSSCRRAKYCSKLCQVYDWRSGRHKMECQFL